MRALVAYPGRKWSVELKEVARPTPGKGDVLLEMLLVGIDGTDREICEGIYGTPPEGCSYLILGHEAFARVAQKGEEVSGVSEGSHVVPTVRRPDGCINCRAGEPDMCVGGGFAEHGISRLHGFASDYALCDSKFLVEVPARLRDVAVLLEPLSIAEKAVSQCYRIQDRLVWRPETALVLGAGPLGLLTCMVLRLRDLQVTVAATRGRKSLKARIARRVGAEYVNANEMRLSEMRERFDLVMEATGKVEPATQAMQLLARNGIMCVLGNYREMFSFENFGRVLREIMMANRVVFGSVNSNKRHFEIGLRDMWEIKRRYGDVLSNMLTRRLRPEEFEEAFRPDREEIKTVIRFNDALG